MKTKDGFNITGTGARFMRLWGEVSQKVFSFVMDEVGELDADHRLFMAVCEAVIDPRRLEGGSLESATALSGEPGLSTAILSLRSLCSRAAEIIRL